MVVYNDLYGAIETWNGVHVRRLTFREYIAKEFKANASMRYCFSAADTGRGENVANLSLSACT